MKRVMWKSVGLILAPLLYAAAGLTANSQTPKKAAAPADLKVRQKMTSGGSDKGMETVVYIKGARMRNEMAGAGMGMTNIRQCDLKRTIIQRQKPGRTSCQ